MRLILETWRYVQFYGYDALDISFQGLWYSVVIGAMMSNSELVVFVWIHVLTLIPCNLWRTVHHLISIICRVAWKCWSHPWQNDCHVRFSEYVPMEYLVICFEKEGILCFQSTHILSDDRDDSFASFYYHNKITAISLWSLFRVRPCLKPWHYA